MQLPFMLKFPSLQSLLTALQIEQLLALDHAVRGSIFKFDQSVDACYAEVIFKSSCCFVTIPTWSVHMPHFHQRVIYISPKFLIHNTTGLIESLPHRRPDQTVTTDVAVRTAHTFS